MFRSQMLGRGLYQRLLYLMTEFVVRRFNNWGVPEIEMVHVEADTEQEAAEKVCGIALTSTPRSQMYLRADVRTAQRMNDHHHFYAVG